MIRAVKGAKIRFETVTGDLESAVKDAMALSQVLELEVELIFNGRLIPIYEGWTSNALCLWFWDGLCEVVE